MSITEFNIIRDFYTWLHEYTPLDYDPNSPDLEEFTEEFPHEEE